ncbi:glycoside hydrolase family 78 protein [Agromyces albus]|uniref:glycoside hydrolase family 78 protein n=1 Tax=Agromyces albus TaxID=205332 RepID=UPI0027D8EF83|nr:glycoside hydrolase family 78 protein [Agromyces albus]
MATPAPPTIEHHRSPIGIGEPTPRLSWKVSGEPGWRQAAAELEIVRRGGVRRWVIETEQQVLVDWPDEPLRSREHAIVRVRVRGDGASWGAWSDPSDLEAGLLEPDDWAAVPVGGAWPEDPDSDDRRPALVRREFEVGDDLVSARLYATAHGLYEAEINGRRVGDDALAPGWTVYPRRLRYYTYDVTELLAPAQRNAIGAWLGDGWYRGRLGWRGGFRNIFGFDQSFLAQLELTYADGRREVIATDAAWRASVGPILRAGNYDGEEYDARLEQPGWSSPGFDDAAWSAVATRKRDRASLVAPQGPPVRCTEVIAPVEVLTSPTGKRIIDFGQNLVGRVRIRVSGEAGDRVTIRTAEVLQHGELYTRPLREAKSTDHYVLAGRAIEEWEPRFTFHGFRYAEVEGWPGDLDVAAARGDLVAAVYHTDLERTGWFESSDPELNRLHENVVWSMRGNFVDIPTDCPQRDERVGWTGDLQVFAPTASFLYDVSGMLAGWLTDVAVEQLPDGTIPWYVPVIPAHHMWTPIRPGAAWGDVATFTPWTLFERFGDVGILRAQYDSARRWVDLQARLAGPDRLWDHGFQLGDWLDPDAPPQDPADGKTDRYLVATAYFAASARFVARMAHVLGHAGDATRYARLADEVRTAFVSAYVGDDGIMTSDAQTAYALALAFDLLPELVRQPAGERLAELVAESGNRISTGFVGTPLVADALSITGHTDVAYDLLMERSCPSWLYAVAHGATTIWERWDSMLPDGTVHSGTMTSFNHYALGAVADWMHRTVAGIAPDAPGYRRIRFAPRPGGGLTWARAEHETPYGRAAISWRIEADRLEVEMTVPLGATAVLDLAGEGERELGPGVHRQVAEFAAVSVP